MTTLVYKPLISEKTLGLASRGWYTFAVSKFARKEQIAREIEKLYNVNVLTVRTIAMHGKVRRTGKKMVSHNRPDWKKAMALLRAGQHIDAFEVTSQAPIEEEKKASKQENKKEEKKVEAKK